jgi:Holliday junction resolvase RusA-like endonuclease
MVIALEGETPPKKNSRINTRTGKSFPSKRYKAWHDEKAFLLNVDLSRGRLQRIPSGNRVKLKCVFFHGDLRDRDSDNQLSSILDLLKDVKIIEDDNWKVVPEKHVYDSYDKGNARCLITLETM